MDALTFLIFAFLGSGTAFFAIGVLAFLVGVVRGED